MANKIRRDEEQRQCPICRMVISAWATKCRYCGEEVGRPKREEQKVTIKDLGGEQTTTYTLSGNVKDALEAFRAEQEMAMEAQRRQSESKGSWFHRKEEPAPSRPAAGQDSFSKLDARHKDLAQSVLADAYTPRPPAARRSGGIPEPIEKALKITGIAIGAVVLITLLVMGTGKLMAYMKTDDTVAPVLMQNEALLMLSRGEPLIEAFEESVRVANYNKTSQDREVMENLRNQLVEEINGLLDKEPYSEANYRKANSLVERAMLIDPSSTFRNLKGVVDAELKAYNMVLKDYDEGAQWAEFTLHNDTYRDQNGRPIPEERAGINGLIQNRFVIQSIRRQGGVVVMDRQRNQRKLVFRSKGADAQHFGGF